MGKTSVLDAAVFVAAAPITVGRRATFGGEMERAFGPVAEPW